jgi:carbon storage regulator
MLILMRKINQSIIIGEGSNQVEMKILDIRGSQVRIGLQAEKDIPIHRKEIYDRIKAAQEKIT